MGEPPNEYTHNEQCLIYGYLGITVNKDSNDKSNFNISPAAVKLWAENLPLASTSETSKQLYRALKEVNLQNNSLSHHLQFLETIAPTLNLLYPRLSKYFTDASLPLTKKTRNVIYVTSSLFTEVLTSYQIIIKKLITKKPFGWKKPLSLALHNIFFYTSQALCAQHLVYQPHSKGSWRKIFWYYQQANKLKLLNKTHHNYRLNQEKTSIDYEFKRLILLSLLSAKELSLKNIKEVLNLMPLWVKHVEILKSETNDKTTCFTLNLLSDIPPYSIGTSKDRNKESLERHFLSTHKLKKILSNYLTKLEADNTVKIGKNTLSKLTIESLLSSWSRNHLRTKTRKEGAGFVDIITSISAIHFVLNQQDQPAYDEVSIELPDNVIDFESTLTIEPLNVPSKKDTLNLGHFLNSSDEEEDIWGAVYKNTFKDDTLPAANWTETGSHKTFSFSKSILLDYNKNGYRLSVNDKTIDSLKHNELVAIREHALAPWALAQVKWLHFSKMGDLQFGIHILSDHVLPVHIRYAANGNLSKPLPCLLGLDRNKLMLFVPTLPTNLNSKKLELEHQKQHSQIHLKNKILSTAAFDIYEIHEPLISDYSSSQNINKNDIIINNHTETHLADDVWRSF